MNEPHLEDIEIDLLLEAIHLRYGYDFRGYARVSVGRRIRRFCSRSGCETPADMIPRLLHDPLFFARILPCFSVNVSEMFRDPPVFRAIRELVVPVLRTYPSLKIWVAGCAGGEEAYSLAILLREEGLYERTTLFATDFNAEVLERAEKGSYSLGSAEAFATNYQQAGGKGSLSDYYHMEHRALVMDRSLRENITFANHNLVTDGAFGEMQMILCRNVLIYFGRQLQSRALELFSESLARRGFLCLGLSESLAFSIAQEDFSTLDARLQIFQRNR
ncbi:MAG: protein-glutamate O-methyltransferase CheR [Planctomycetes bacterium]|nr:protein-glutamate O-methyltransferase CheR [Planctomycetota bacterium]